jgi:hypothetical protein
MVASFKRVRNKNALLARISEASLNRPEGAVREVVFPVAGGEQTLREVVAEFRAAGPEFRRNVQVKLRASYSHHYRAGMVKLLRTLVFRSNNGWDRNTAERGRELASPLVGAGGGMTVHCG